MSDEPMIVDERHTHKTPELYDRLLSNINALRLALSECADAVDATTRQMQEMAQRKPKRRRRKLT